MIDVIDGGPKTHMPTYQYRCTECGNELEAVQKFTDPSLTTCPTCAGALRKVFGAVGVVFKGSGFYSTDSRKKSSETASTGAKSDASSTSAVASTNNASSDSSKPAPAKKADAPA